MRCELGVSPGGYLSRAYYAPCRTILPDFRAPGNRPSQNLQDFKLLLDSSVTMNIPGWHP